ncbi:rhodanese domain-containing protein [Thamnocephalis sphaerospora]|uniref:Rhodanese domain-containing protein n=1 Tax=Thamnocephalis sphaerospora TaxID=78915 RepID=A0A4P9XQK0_9FUNG|nr:rhodanese domain-containing protein [Thamnocephalis sphaerospora]|eukprot:RKP08317.1 rhodanese domain-containing protein [Thamnocephalis sphaerospora]
MTLSDRKNHHMPANTSDLSLCTPAWLQQHLNDRDTVVLDSTWHLPTTGRNAAAEYLEAHIPGARRFDIDAVADQTTSLPHMLPTPDAFAASELGIGNADRVIVYDNSDVRSAYRAYWMFKVFGHDRVSVLNGGLGAWRHTGLLLESGAPAPVEPKTFTAQLPSEQVVNYDQVQENIERAEDDAGRRQILDARGAPRFSGALPEMRPGLSSGHMPGAINVPYSQVFVPETGEMRSSAELRELFEKRGVRLDHPIITSCGSGVTACVLYAALQHAGATAPIAVYDGSWTEYASRPTSRIVKQTV